MYYMWNGWWWFLWLVPILLILWFVFGGVGRRYGYARHRYPYGDGDDAWMIRHREGAARRYRSRGPKNYRRPDSRIQEDVCDRLMVDDDLDPTGIEVRVEGGVVSLAGTVASRFEKRAAEQIADSVAGVTDVENQLRIGKPEAVAPPTDRRGTQSGQGA